MKINNYLDDCKKKLDLSADLKLADELGVTRSVVSSWRKGRQAPDMFSCFQIGDILMIDPKIVMANVKSEVESDEFRQEFWIEKVKEYGYADNYLLSVISVFMMIILSSVLLLRDKMSSLFEIGYEAYLDVLYNLLTNSEILFFITCNIHYAQLDKMAQHQKIVYKH